jgi:pimeloyl-ACP methyl ester carboxylesterase
MSAPGRPQVLAAAAQPPGGYRLVFRPSPRPGTPACWLALPDRPDPHQPALVAVHGIRRGAEEQARLWAPGLAPQGRIVIAPLFDALQWPHYQRLGGGAAAALLGLLDELAQEPTMPLALPLARVDLFGFSGGAQFAHRFAMLHPERLRRLALAAAGWYTFPDAAPYPYGLGPPETGAGSRSARMQSRLDAFLALPVDICVGERDCKRDANTRSGARIDAQQGRHRRARASRWSEALAVAAAVRGVRSQVRFTVLPGCGHSFRQCVQRGGLLKQVLRALPAPAPAAAAPWLATLRPAPQAWAPGPLPAWPAAAARGLVPASRWG